MGRILFKQGEYDEAARCLETSLVEDVHHNARVLTWAYLRLWIFHDMRKERGRARGILTPSQEVTKKDPP